MAVFTRIFNRFTVFNRYNLINISEFQRLISVNFAINNSKMPPKKKTTTLKEKKEKPAPEMEEPKIKKPRGRKAVAEKVLEAEPEEQVEANEVNEQVAEPVKRSKRVVFNQNITKVDPSNGKDEKPPSKRGRKPSALSEKGLTEKPATRGKKQVDSKPKEEEEPEPETKPATGKRTKKETEKSKQVDSKPKEEEEPEPETKPTTGKRTKKETEKSKQVDSKPNEEEEPELETKHATVKKTKKETDTSTDNNTKSKKGKKVAAEKQDNSDVPAKRGRKQKTEEDIEEKPDKKAPLNQTKTAHNDINFECTKLNKMGNPPNFVISSWNVDGLRAWLKKDGLTYVDYEKPDIFCVQESKCSLDKLPPEVKNLESYKQYWHNSDKEGYAGVGLFTRTMPIDVQYGIGIEEHDDEGRCVTAEFKKFYLVNVYVPNAGRKLVTLPKRLEWNKAFKSFIKELDEKKPVIICGDMNVAHLEIDLTNPKTNTKNAGFTKEEREGMTEFLSDGYVDTYRKLYPDKTGAYTFWTYMMNSRSKNVGWRLDYFIVSQRLMDNVCDNVIRNEVYGSDHCPITLFLNI